MNKILGIFVFLIAVSQLLLDVLAKTVVDCQAPVDGTGSTLAEISSGIQVKFTCHWPESKRVRGAEVKVRMVNTQSKIKSSMSGTTISGADTTFVSAAEGSKKYETTLTLGEISADLREVKFCVYDDRDTIKSHKGCTPPVRVKTNANPIAVNGDRGDLVKAANAPGNEFKIVPKSIIEGKIYGPMRVTYTFLDPKAIEVVLLPNSRFARPIPVAAQQINGDDSAVQVSFTAPVVNSKGQFVKICLRYKASRKIITCSPPVQNGEFLVPKRKLFGRPAAVRQEDAPVRNLVAPRNDNEALTDGSAIAPALASSSISQKETAPIEGVSLSNAESGSDTADKAAQKKYAAALTSAFDKNVKELPELLQKEVEGFPAEAEPFSGFSPDLKLLTEKLLAALVDKENPIPAEELKYTATLLEFSPGQLKTIFQMIDDKAANEEIPAVKPPLFINDGVDVRKLKQSASSPDVRRDEVSKAPKAPTAAPESDSAIKTSEFITNNEALNDALNAARRFNPSQVSQIVREKVDIQNKANINALPEGEFDSIETDSLASLQGALKSGKITLDEAKYAAFVIFKRRACKTVIGLFSGGGNDAQRRASGPSTNNVHFAIPTDSGASNSGGSSLFDSDASHSSLKELSRGDSSSDLDEQQQTLLGEGSRTAGNDGSSAPQNYERSSPGTDQINAAAAAGPLGAKILELIEVTKNMDSSGESSNYFFLWSMKRIEAADKLSLGPEKRVLVNQILEIIQANAEEVNPSRKKLIFMKTNEFQYGELKTIFNDLLTHDT